MQTGWRNTARQSHGTVRVWWTAARSAHCTRLLCPLTCLSLPPASWQPAATTSTPPQCLFLRACSQLLNALKQGSPKAEYCFLCMDVDSQKFRRKLHFSFPDIPRICSWSENSVLSSTCVTPPLLLVTSGSLKKPSVKSHARFRPLFSVPVH